MLTRLGNKRKLRAELNRYFPDHKLRIELFFGAGGSFFYLPAPKNAIINDLDDDVTNLYLVVLNSKDELIEAIKKLPISDSLVKKWKEEQFKDPILKALRFLLLSNFTYLGKGDTLRFGYDNAKVSLLQKIDLVFERLQNVKIMNEDFRDVIPKISFSKKLVTKEESFVYLDPVYLDTEHYYKVPKWSLKDSEDCFKIMANSGIPAAMSEFNHPDIMDLCVKYNMVVTQLKERQNIKNRKVEILITNYKPQLTLF